MNVPRLTAHDLTSGFPDLRNGLAEDVEALEDALLVEQSRVRELRGDLYATQIAAMIAILLTLIAGVWL